MIPPPPPDASLILGRFAVVGDTITGPRDYMEARGSDLIDRIMAGHDLVFNLTWEASPDIRVAMLARLQADWLAWQGRRRAEKLLPLAG